MDKSDAGLGSRSLSGERSPHTQKQPITFQVRDVLSADFQGEREHKKADCLPLHLAPSAFSGAIARVLAESRLCSTVRKENVGPGTGRRTRRRTRQLKCFSRGRFPKQQLFLWHCLLASLMKPVAL